RGSQGAALSPVSFRRLRPGSLDAIPRSIRAAGSCPGGANIQAVMDTQRLVLFVIFSFSALLLWEAWQKETRPPPAPPAPTAPQGKSASTPPADLPAVPTAPAPQAGSPTASAPGAVPAAPPAASGAVGTTGRLITITTDLYRAQVDTTGGTITEVQLVKHRDPHDETKPYTLLLKTPERTNVAQSGLLGEGMPNHRSTYEALP